MKKVFLIIQSFLCVLLALLLITAVIVIYRSGAAARAEDPLAAIYSREIAAEVLRTIAPLFFAAAGSAAAGMILTSENESGPKSVPAGKVENRTSGGKKVRIVMLIAAVLLIAAGIFNGSAGDVLGKAVKICTECVGLG